MISEFQGQYRWLSNFWPCKINICLEDGRMVEAKTLEHAYQAKKASTVADALWIISAATPGDAKRRAKENPIRANWGNRKLLVMENLIALKFAPGSELAKRLMDTGGEILQEGNMWHDMFWGQCLCPLHRVTKGSNHLGRLLIEWRECLISYEYEEAGEDPHFSK